MLKRILAGLIVAVVMASPALAGPLEDGEAAYQRRDYATALKLLQPLAEQGAAGAQSVLGAMYGYGRGVPQDYTEATKWYRLAVAQGDAQAQFNLGLLYSAGRGVPLDFAVAEKWFRLAAAQGLTEAQLFLAALDRGPPAGAFDDGATAYNRGDYSTALKLWRPLAAQGDTKAQTQLGNMYAEGEGVAQDYAQAVTFCRTCGSTWRPHRATMMLQRAAIPSPS